MNETMISRKAKLFVESLNFQEEKVSESHNPKGFNLHLQNVTLCLKQSLKAIVKVM